MIKTGICILMIGILLILVVIRSNFFLKEEKNLPAKKTSATDIEDEIFSAYNEKANQKIQTLSLEEKIAQLFIIGISTNSDIGELKKYQFGGYLFFKDFFNNKTKEQVKKEINDFQLNSKIPLLIAVDEEGGDVVRVSNNPNLAKESFKSPSDIYRKGGLEAIEEDTVCKSILLEELGINLNFAPVVDISINPKNYMYKRTLQEGKELTSKYAKTVINISKNYKVSYTLKHFPGYGDNKDTHTNSSVDERSYIDIYKNDLEPFRAGIEAGAEVVMVSHNIVKSIDDKNPSSISKIIHNLLRNELKFTGIIITDDIAMEAIQKQYTIPKAIIKAILAGNDMIIISIDKNTKNKIDNTKVNYEIIIENVKQSLENGEITQKDIDKAVARILAWKYYKKLIN